VLTRPLEISANIATTGNNSYRPHTVLYVLVSASASTVARVQSLRVILTKLRLRVIYA